MRAKFKKEGSMDNTDQKCETIENWPHDRDPAIMDLAETIGPLVNALDGKINVLHKMIESLNQRIDKLEKDG